MKKLKLTLIKSVYGRIPRHRATVAGLGLRKKIGTMRILEDTPAVRGMVNQVSYLLRVEEIKS